MFKMIARSALRSIGNAGMNAIGEISDEIKKVNDSGIKQSNKLSKDILTDKHVKMCLLDLRYELDIPHINAKCDYDNEKGVVTGWNLVAKNVELKTFKYKDELTRYIKRLIVGENQDSEKIHLLKKYYTAVSDGSMTDEDIQIIIDNTLNLHLQGEA